MRNFPLHQNHSFGFTRLKGITWANQGLGENKLLIVQRAAGDALASMVKGCAGNSPLIVDSRDIQRVEDDALGTLAAILKGKGHQIFFTGASTIFRNDLDRMLGPITQFNLGEQGTLIVCGESTVSQESAVKLVDDAKRFANGEVHRFVADCLHKHRDGKLHRMESTLLKSNGIFDAREIIKDPARFTWVSLALADRLDALVATRSFPPTTRLLAVSLRGSPFAAAASLLSNAQMKVEIVDHMGPKHRILEEHDLGKRHQSPEYVYVGDFIVGGTELKIARTYADTRGSVIRHALVVGSLLPADEYRASSGIEVNSLATLGEVRPEVQFEFVGAKNK